MGKSGRNVLKAKLDIIFKKIFSENKKLLIDLLSSLLQIPIESIKNVVIKNSEILPDSLTGKFVRMDLNMEVDGKLINIEMQYGKDYHYKDRTLFYWSKLYSGALQSGEDFENLKQSICINIVDFALFDCKEFHSHFSIMEKDRHEILTDKLAIHFFELGKISKQANKDNKMELWLQFVNAETEEEFEMLKQTGVAPIQEAIYVLYQMSDDEKIQEAARLREKALHIEASNISGAKQEASDERAKAIARKMLKRDKPIEEIIEFTGLTLEDVTALK